MAYVWLWYGWPHVPEGRKNPIHHRLERQKLTAIFRLSTGHCHLLQPTCRLTLRASPSGTFLQTLPELVTPLKAFSEGFGYYNHTPSIAFRHRPPNSARFGHATEGALFISAQLSTDAVSALRKVWILTILTRLWKQHSAQSRT